MSTRTILHSDCNSFFASVACLYQPEIRNKPVVVGGNESLRHGIVLAANQLAKKKYWVRTGEALFAVRQRCPDLVVVPPDRMLYQRFADMTREIYRDYTDQVEPYGLDESFLDVTGSVGLFGDGEVIADTIRGRIRQELGITVSIGVGPSKSIAKLASDMRKPDFTTVIGRSELKEKVWPLPVGDLLYVGGATAAKLNRQGVFTIGDLARSDRKHVIRWVNSINGGVLWDYANGYDDAAVRRYEDCLQDDGMKGISHSTTTPKDLMNERDVGVTVAVLAEAVAARLRRHKRLCRTVQLWLRDSKLRPFQKQGKTPEPTNLAVEIADTAMRLFRSCYGSLGTRGSALLPLRTVSVRGTDLTRESDFMQLSFLPEAVKRQNQMTIEHTIDDLRARYGHTAVTRGILFTDKALGSVNPKDDHIFTFPGVHQTGG